jgi:hypothetical protein
MAPYVAMSVLRTASQAREPDSPPGLPAVTDRFRQCYEASYSDQPNSPDICSYEILWQRSTMTLDARILGDDRAIGGSALRSRVR